MQPTVELSKNGICHLVLSHTLPTLPEGKVGARIRALIEELLAMIKKRAEELLPSLAEAYEADTNPKKRLLHRPLLLSAAFSLTEEGSTLRLTLLLSLFRSGRTLSQIEKAVRLDGQSGRFLYEIKERKERRKKP